MFITLDDILCMLYLPIRGKLLYHGRVNKDDASKMILDYLGVNPEDALHDLEAIKGGHARF